MAEAIELDGFVETRKELEALMASNPETERKIQGMIRQVLREARKVIQGAARSAMDSDPRKAYLAVRSSIYKRILGGNLNILSKRHAGALHEPMQFPPMRGRGGNRRQRSGRTFMMQSYYGSDRGFVLRFLDGGTADRSINFVSDSRRESVNRGSRGGNLNTYGRTTNTGSRGKISPRNWFGGVSDREINAAAGKLAKMIDDMIEQAFKR